MLIKNNFVKMGVFRAKYIVAVDNASPNARDIRSVCYTIKFLYHVFFAAMLRGSLENL